MPDDTTSILIVDDLPEKILVYRSVLEELGQHVVAATSGADALKQVLRNDFAVILLDVNMPEMDGFETARLIRQRRLSAHVPIIFLTAFADEVRTAEGYATGGVDYLPTPVVPEILRAKVRVFVDLYRLRQQVAHQAEEQARRTVAEEAARRFEFLSDASRVVASSLDVAATLRGLTRLAVPFLADLAFAGLVDDTGQTHRAEWSWGGTSVAGMSGSATGPGPRGRLADAVARAIATRRAEHVTDLGEPASTYCPNEPEDSAPPAFRLTDALVLPLVARGETLGVLALAQGPSGRRFELQDVALGEELASRAGIALQNALLVRNIQDNDLRKDEFLAMLAHELRNPLAPIRTGLDLLSLSGADDEIVEPMQRQVDHLVRLVDDLLDVSRITRGAISLQRQVVDLRRVVAGAVETSRPLIEERGHSLDVTVADEPLIVNGDPIRLTQVLTNLLNNAARYTPDGGAIWLIAERDGTEIVLRVRDCGTGIATEMLPKIFDLFVQADRSLDRSKGGLGIGLTLVRRLAEMHQGNVQAFSEGLGRGSEFVVRLPATTGERKVAEKSALGPPMNGAQVRRRILVVDDNRDAATTLQMLLRLGGHEVRLAYDGPTALEAANEFAPDIVLLDIGLPGIDGYEVARRLRKNAETEGALLIAVSGYGQDDDQRRSKQAGFDRHLVKPVDFPVLQRVLADAATPVATDAAQ